MTSEFIGVTSNQRAAILNGRPSSHCWLNGKMWRDEKKGIEKKRMKENGGAAMKEEEERVGESF